MSHAHTILDPSVALIISIAVILLLIRKGTAICLSILAGAVTLGLLSLGQKSFEVLLLSAVSPETIRIVCLVIAAFTLGYSMEYLGLFEELQKAAERLTHKFSVSLLPLLVGLLPMPGGALVSAVMIRNLVKKYGLTPEESTFINYWFRHVWVTVWPLYPSIIIATAVVEVSPARIAKACWVIGLTAFTSALISAVKLGILRRRFFSFDWRSLASMTKSFYPIAFVAIFVLLLRTSMLYTLIVAIAIVYVHKKAKIRDIISILKKTLDPKIIVLIFAVMGYKALIEYTNSAKIFFTHLKEFGIPAFAASFAVAFLVGFATGIELSYSSVALPLLTAFTGVGSSLVPSKLMLVIAGGFCGVMLSPMHLCFALTCEYFHADASKVYRYLIPSVVVVALASITAYILGVP